MDAEPQNRETLFTIIYPLTMITSMGQKALPEARSLNPFYLVQSALHIEATEEYSVPVPILLLGHSVNNRHWFRHKDTSVECPRVRCNLLGLFFVFLPSANELRLIKFYICI